MPVRQGASGLPEFLEVWFWIVLGVFDTVRRVAALPEHVGAFVAPFCGVVQMEESPDGGVGLVDGCRRNAMTGQGEEADVLQRVPHGGDEAFARLAAFMPVPQVADGQGSCHERHQPVQFTLGVWR